MWVNILLILVLLIIMGVMILYHTTGMHLIRVKKGTITEFKTAMELAGLPIITFYQEDRKYNFLLDTGSNVSYADLNSDLILNKIEGVVDSFVSGSGERQSTDVAVAELDLRGNHYECIFRVTDLGKAFASVKQSTGVTLNGIIGNDFMEKYKYCLDFKELIVYVRK